MIQFKGHCSTALSQSHLLAEGEALLTALIWSSSFVGVKVVLLYVGPFTVAGLRYFIASLFLFPWLWRNRQSSPSLTRQQWSRFVMIALFQCTIGNSALFFALKTLSATTGALALCLVPIPVLLLGMMRLKERPRPLQLVALAITLGGSVLFFSPSVSCESHSLLGSSQWQSSASPHFRCWRGRSPAAARWTISP